MAFKDEILDWMYSEVLKELGISRREIEPDIREKRVIRARHLLYLALRRRGNSTAEIGRQMMRDHTTVMSGIRTALKHYEQDAQFRELVDRLAA